MSGMFDDPIFDRANTDQASEGVQPDSMTGDGKPPRRSVAAQLVDLARDAYTLTADEQGDAYGVDQRRPHIALPLRGGKTGLRAELARRFFTDHNIVPSQQALADACMVLEGYAAQQNPQRVYLRVAEHRGSVYIDMGDTAGRVIKVSAGKRTPTYTAPVLFRRTKLTGALPDPTHGDLSTLWEFVPIDDADRPVLLAWLVAALIQPDVPHPILALLAEQGSAKSTITRLLVSLVDPSPVPLRKAPRDADSWVTAAAASWVVALDNLSGTIPGWLSDSLCRASTGDGDVRRALYTDNDVSTFAFRRVPIINGIDVTFDGGDLAERLVAIDLARITPKDRRPEDELARTWETARPGIFGALLDLAAKVHHRLPAVTVADMPRMADFAKTLAAVDGILDTTGMERYRQRSKRVAADTLGGPFIAELIEQKLTAANVKSAELLTKVTPTAADWKQPKEWPKNARAVTNELTRHSPALRALGWRIDSDRGQNKDGITRWTITAPEKGRNADPPDPPDPSTQVNGQKGGGSTQIALPANGEVNPPSGSGGEPAGHAQTINPPHLPGVSRADGSAGQAGQKNGQSLVRDTACRYCNVELRLPSALKRGFCSRARCLKAHRQQTVATQAQ